MAWKQVNFNIIWQIHCHYQQIVSDCPRAWITLTADTAVFGMCFQSYYLAVQTSWSVTQWKLDFVLNFMFIFSTRLVCPQKMFDSNRLCIGICAKRSSYTTKFQLQLWIKTANWAGSLTSVLSSTVVEEVWKMFILYLRLIPPSPKLFAVFVFSPTVLLKHVFEFLCFPMTCFQPF